MSASHIQRKNRYVIVIWMKKPCVGLHLNRVDSAILGIDPEHVKALVEHMPIRDGVYLNIRLVCERHIRQEPRAASCSGSVGLLRRPVSVKRTIQEMRRYTGHWHTPGL